MLGAVFFFFGGVVGLAVVALAFASVVLHELGHALVARHLGVGVAAIELHFFGGVARMTDEPKSDNDEIAIAVAGPMVSLSLSALSYGIYGLTGWWVFALLASINLFVGVFNMIPAFPMDGGRVLRAVLSKFKGRSRATEIAVKVSRIASIAFAVMALFIGSVQLFLLAGVVWYLASAELRNSRLMQAFRRGRWQGFGFEAPPMHPARDEQQPEYVFRSHRRGRPQRVVVVRYE